MLKIIRILMLKIYIYNRKELKVPFLTNRGPHLIKNVASAN